MEKSDFWEEDVYVNPAQMAFMLLQAKTKYVIYSRGTGKSFINGYEVDENVRLMPRGVTTVAQATYGQAFTKTLPSTFKMLEQLGYRRYDTKTKLGDYVVCRQPPEGWYRPHEHIMSFDRCITFSNGHCLYVLTQDGNSRGPNADYNITDEALTIDKTQFDQEVAPTNRGNEHIFGKLTDNPLYKHHGNTFLSSMPYTPEQKWLLEPAKYYEEERGILLFEIWNRIVKLQMQLIDASLEKDVSLFKEIWNETIRLRHSITPFVSKTGVLFILGSIFDNMANLGMGYILNMYSLMDRLTFMIEILNYYLERIDDCYYSLDERHSYYHASNDDYIRDLAENTNYNWDSLSEVDCRHDIDCNPTQPIEITCDWGSNTAFMEVAQEKNFDYKTKLFSERKIDTNINEFFVKRNNVDDTMINALIDKFTTYYAPHISKEVIFFRDKYGDSKRANSKKSYNELAIDRLVAAGWTVIQKTHPGMEPPQHDKYLLWSVILTEKDERYPIKRFNAKKCKFTLISMNNTRVITDPTSGKFSKDKSSERRQSVLPEEATHFGDAVDKRIWIKYGEYLQNSYSFVDAKI